MVDIVDPFTRSRMMSGIRGKDTRPELLIRRALHREGFRFKLHDRSLPGAPDLVLPKYKAVVLVHGCFWHRHENCYYAATPSTRRDFWLKKLGDNVRRDELNRQLLLDAGWRVFTIWECGLRHNPEVIVENLAMMLLSPSIRERQLPDQPARRMGPKS